MRTDLTNSQLLALHNDIINQSHSSPAFYYLNKEKVKRFYQQNSLLVKLIETKMNSFIKKYVLHEEGEDGKPLTEEKDGKLVYKFATPELETQYKTEVEAFMTRTVKIEL